MPIKGVARVKVILEVVITGYDEAMTMKDFHEQACNRAKEVVNNSIRFDQRVFLVDVHPFLMTSEVKT